MTTTAAIQPPAALPAPSEMRRLIHAFDWSATPNGAMPLWPAPLTAAVGLILNAELPMILLWGPTGVCIYNDAYAVFAAARHPALLGSNVLDGWPEVAALNQRVLDTCLAGRTMSLRDEHVVLHRNGHAEDVWLDLDYSPIPGADGAPAGVLAVVNETTLRVLSDWRRREAETQLALAIDAADLGIWERDLTTGAINWTARCKALFGLPPAHTVSRADFEAGLHPVERDAVLAALARAMDPQCRAAYDIEYRAIGRMDGITRWIAAKGKAVFDETGRALRINGTMLDITLRKNAERRHAALAALGDRLRGLDTTADIAAAAAEILARALNAPRAGYAVVQGDHAFVERDWTDGVAISLAGPRLFASLGEKTIAPLRAGRMVIIDDVETAPETEDCHAAFKAIGATAVLNAPLLENGAVAAILYVHDNRARHWTQDEVRLLEDVADRTWEASRRVRATAGLKRLNETLEQEIGLRTAQRDRMWKLSSDVMLVCRFDGEIVSVNPAWTVIFNWQDHDLLGRNILELTHPMDQAAVRAELGHLEAGQITKKFDARHRHRDGSYRWLSWRAAPDETGVHAVGRDITAEREQAGALQAAEEALRQAQKMEAVGQLTGGIAHDFNNLLQGIVGALDLIDKRIADGRFADIEKFAAAARTSAARAVSLTHRLLAFSRRQPLDPKPVEANPLAGSMEELLRRTLGETITLTLKLAPDLWPTLCDPNQLESAILNLAINARDAMPDGGFLILETCNTKLDDAYAARTPGVKPGDYICVSVSDSGSGMPPSVIAQAFEPFFTTKPIGQGTGLGLSMIYGFAKQSEGHARIYSEVGHGTTVKLFLPRHLGNAATDDAAPEHAAPGPAGPAAAGEIVLVVEDEAVVRGLVLDVLEELGYQALQAADGPSGLDILRGRQRIDLLVTDIGLPGLNGRQLADAARLIRPDLKILFMTGYAENAAVARGFLEPGMEMVTKPFPLDTLATRIRAMIQS